jgi:hypothetical protein
MICYVVPRILTDLWSVLIKVALVSQKRKKDALILSFSGSQSIKNTSPFSEKKVRVRWYRCVIEECVCVCVFGQPFFILWWLICLVLWTQLLFVYSFTHSHSFAYSLWYKLFQEMNFNSLPFSLLDEQKYEKWTYTTRFRINKWENCYVEQIRCVHWYIVCNECTPTIIL